MHIYMVIFVSLNENVGEFPMGVKVLPSNSRTGEDFLKLFLCGASEADRVSSILSTVASAKSHSCGITMGPHVEGFDRAKTPSLRQFEKRYYSVRDTILRVNSSTASCGFPPAELGQFVQ